MLLFRNFIGETGEVYTFLHNTPTEAMARRIMKEGLVFENHLLNTADQVSGDDLIELNYFRMIRKYYGDHTVVIQVASALVDELNKRLEKSHLHFSEVLSRSLPAPDGEDVSLYLLPPQFIRGYFDHTREEGTGNPLFNPGYRPPFLEKNLSQLPHSH